MPSSWALPAYGTYPAEELTPQLLALFEAAGLPDVWKNYRLKGAQGQFVDATGEPILLGNSVTEKGKGPGSWIGAPLLPISSGRWPTCCPVPCG